jgi:uncharacterized protein (DUF2141 family)
MQLFRLSTLVAAAISSLGAATSAQAESAVTVRVAGIHSAAGRVVVALCADPAAGFPGACVTHSGNAPAKAGEVLIGITKVPDGRYAVQAFHDENGDFRPQIPPEGYAFGNASSWPTSFDAAAVQVTGDTEIALTMEYVGRALSARTQTHPATLQLPAGSWPQVLKFLRTQLKADKS